MTINTQKNNNQLTLKIEGRLDTTTAPSLEKLINELPADVNDLLFDMSELVYLQYLSSSDDMLFLHSIPMCVPALLHIQAANSEVLPLFLYALLLMRNGYR